MWVQYRRRRRCRIRRVKLFSVLLWCCCLFFSSVSRWFLVVVRDFYTPHCFFFYYSVLWSVLSCTCDYTYVCLFISSAVFFTSSLFVNNISLLGWCCCFFYFLLLFASIAVPPVVVPLFPFFLGVLTRCTYLRRCHPIPKPAAAANQWCQVDARCWLRFYRHLKLEGTNNYKHTTPELCLLNKVGRKLRSIACSADALLLRAESGVDCYNYHNLIIILSYCLISAR